MPTPTLLAAIAVDLIAVTVTAGPLYFRRHRRRDLMLSYLALNIGVLGVALALSGSQVGVGLGLGLFGVLSIVRLRSDQISQAEIAYYFTALALGLLAALGAGSVWMPATFAVLLLAVLYVVDHPRLLPAQHRRVVTLDRAYLDEKELWHALAGLLGGEVTRLEVHEIDLVRDTTVVDVRYRATGRPVPVSPVSPVSGMITPAPCPAGGTIAMPAPFTVPGIRPDPRVPAGQASRPEAAVGAGWRS